MISDIATDWVNDYLGDLWMYNLVTGLWTWLGGSQYVNEIAIYGSMGVPAAANLPGSRLAHSMVFDDAALAIYVFGGLANWGTGNRPIVNF